MVSFPYPALARGFGLRAARMATFWGMAATPLADQPDARRTSPPESLRELVDRFDPEVIDVPGGAARIRLSVRDAEDWDALLAGGGIWLSASAARLEPDALLTADEETWDRIARDVRGGMDAFRRRRLEVRRNLHLGVGFLAATSGMTEPGRLRFGRARTAHGEISYQEAGMGDPVVLMN